MYVGPETRATILYRIVRPTCVISRIYAYPRTEANGSKSLVIHIVSDDGEHNTIIKRLLQLYTKEISTVYGIEREDEDPVHIAWVHARSSHQVPIRAQPLYARFDPPIPGFDDDIVEVDEEDFVEVDELADILEALSDDDKGEES